MWPLYIQNNKMLNTKSNVWKHIASYNVISPVWSRVFDCNTESDPEITTHAGFVDKHILTIRIYDITGVFLVECIS